MAMNKLNVAVFGAMAVSFMFGGARAADISTGLGIGNVEPILEMQNPSLWNGAYAGLQGGLNWRSFNPDNAGDSETGIGKNIGGYVGLNQQLGNYLVGGLEWQGGYVGKSVSEGGFTVKQDWETSLRARMGYAFEQNLIYGLAGVAASRLEVSNTTDSDSSWLTGYTVGAGIERQFTDRITGRVEYDFSDYGKEQFNLGPTSTETGLNSHNVKVGVGFKF